MPKLSMSQLSATRFRRPSIRGMLALGGAAAMVTGVVAGTDTLAATTDSATASVSQIASENFFPAPVGSNIKCSIEGTNGAVWTRFRLNWDAPSGVSGLTYVVEAWKDNNSLGWTGDTSVTNYAGINPDNNTTTRYRVRTKNAQGELSQGYISYTVKTGLTHIISCQTAYGPENVATWQEGTSFTPAAPEVITSRSGTDVSGRSPSAVESTKPSTPSSTPPSTTPSEKPAEDEAPTSSATTPPPSTSETPKPSETSTPAPEAKVTFAVGAGGGERGLTVFLDGEESCDFTLEEGFTPSISGNTLVIQNGDVVKNVDPKTCALS